MDTMTKNDTTPRAWVGCLACYNAGRLVGDWFDGIEAGEVDTEDLHAQQSRVGAEYADHEELWVMDHEGYGGLLKGECSPAEAQRLAELLESVDDPAAFAVFVAHFGEPDTDAFEEAYAGEWRDEIDYAEHLLDEIGEIPNDGSLASRYFNYEAFARDLFMSDYYSAPALGGGVYVFRVI